MSLPVESTAAEATPPFRWRAALPVLARLPQGALSRAAGWLADLPLPGPLRRPVLTLFAGVTGIDTSEAERPLRDYPTLNAFFVRRLRPGSRTWPGEAGVVASPVDGVMGQSGAVHDGVLLQAKGRPYDAATLLGDAAEARRFSGGAFITIYLAPHHYHRIHAPVSGEVRWARHVPGGLMPVNAAAVRLVPELFVRNERLAAGLETAVGPVALVAVGAYNVGRISAAFDAAWSGAEAGWITNRRHPPPALRRYHPGLPVQVGDEFMAFHLGSTVVLLLPPGLALAPDLRSGLEVRAGSILARSAAAPHLSGSDAPTEGPGSG